MTKIYRYLYLTIIVFVFVIMSSGCAGTINTVRYSTQENQKYHKVYIISAENSQYIQFKPGIIVPIGTYIILPDDPAVEHQVIGNTDTVIKKELEIYGINSEIVKKGDVLGDFDLIIEYHDTWRWDFKKVLDKLEILFISPNGEVISKSIFDIHKNKEMHNFPTPEKEVPKMIKELLAK